MLIHLIRETAVLVVLLTQTQTTAMDSNATDVDPCFQRELSEIAWAARSQQLDLLLEKSEQGLCSALPVDWQSAYLDGYLGYRLATLQLGTQKKIADQTLRAAVEDLNRAIEANEKCAVCHALLSVVHGQQISIKPFRGINLGPRTGRHMKKAHEIGTEKVVVTLLDGIGKFHTPGTFGGGPDKSLAPLKQAAASFDAQEQQFGFDLADAQFWYGMALIRTGNQSAGKQTITGALEIQPDFAAALHVLNRAPQQ